MPAQVISIGESRACRQAAWLLLEMELPGYSLEPIGVLLADEETDSLTFRLRPSREFGDLEEQAADILDCLADDLAGKALEMGSSQLMASLEESCSGFFRVSDRTQIAYSGNPQRTTDKLFDEYVDATVRPFMTHIPAYTLRAAATKFGEGMNVEADSWVRTPERLRVTEDMFAAWVVGRSMEPMIPDGSLCAFRERVVGSRKGKLLLVEKFDETDFASRYTVKRYKSEKQQTGEEEWVHTSVRLEPLNPEFEAFELAPDAFRVVGEFVEVLDF